MKKYIENSKKTLGNIPKGKLGLIPVKLIMLTDPKNGFGSEALVERVISNSIKSYVKVLLIMTWRVHELRRT